MSLEYETPEEVKDLGPERQAKLKKEVYPDWFK